jgi:hypothetical protein
MTVPHVQLPSFLRPLFLVVDLGFIAYWAITLAGVIPDAFLFKDYDNPILSAWNWSFLPLDLAMSATGLTALRLRRVDSTGATSPSCPSCSRRAPG